MEKKLVKHYILGTYIDNNTQLTRNIDLQEIVKRYDVITNRIRKALLANEVENPDQYITYTFRMMGDYDDNTFHRKELVEINLEHLRNKINDFPWEDWGWVQAIQPLVDVAGYTIVEIDSEYQSFANAPLAPEDYVQPCYRIYEGGSPEWDVYEKMRQTRKQRRRHDDEPIDIEPEPVGEKSWFGEIGEALKENVPTVLAVITSVTAVAMMLRTAQNAASTAEASAARSEEILRHIEDTIDDAIDMPQIVKVELGDDIEVIGTGRRTW